MANFSVKFHDLYDHQTSLEAYHSGNDTIVVRIIEDVDCIAVEMDKSTAIKFAKTLRTEINKIEE